MPNKPIRGGTWTPQEILAVWQKGTVVPGHDPALLRKDTCGAWMEFSQHGDTTPGGRGWEIDHVYPTIRGGHDELANLQPLQWENNRTKGDHWPHWDCALKD